MLPCPSPSLQKEILLNKNELKTQIKKPIDLINKISNRMDTTYVN